MKDTFDTRPTRPDPTRPDPLDFSRKNRQFHYRISTRPTTPDHDPANSDPTNVLRGERKGPIIPRFSGGGYVILNGIARVLNIFEKNRLKPTWKPSIIHLTPLQTIIFYIF